MMRQVIYTLADEKNAKLFNTFIDYYHLDSFDYSRLVITELADIHNIRFVDDRLVEFIYIFTFLKARMKFFQIVISVSVGLAAGCIPLVGYNTGAGRPDRVRSLFTTLLTAEGCTGLAGLILTEFFPQSIIGLFGASQESAYYTQFALRSFRLYLCMASGWSTSGGYSRLQNRE